MIDFVSDPTALLRNADRVISMGGYNTISELLSYEKRTLVVPRVTPRREQLIRAQRFSQLGLLDVCHPDEMTPKKLGDWIARDVAKPPLGRIDFDGRLRLPELLLQVSPTAQAAGRVV